MEANNPFTRNVITTLHMVLLTSMYLYLRIQKAISNFDWPKAFRNMDTNQNCKSLTDTLMNIFRNQKNSIARALSV